MEEAGEKVEDNLEEIRMTYSKKIQKLEDVVEKVCNIFLFVILCLINLHIISARHHKGNVSKTHFRVEKTDARNAEKFKQIDRSK